MDEDINEHVDENRTPNLREPNENLFSREFDFSTHDGRVFAQELRTPAAGIKQTSDPLGALVPVVLAGATCVVAKLFHKQHKQQKDLKHKQGTSWLRPQANQSGSTLPDAAGSSCQVTSVRPRNSCKQLKKI